MYGDRKKVIMKFCSYCGNQIEESTIFCPNCGAKVETQSSNSENGEVYTGDVTVENEAVNKRSTPIAVLSFFFPLVGLILWAVWKETKPGCAISAAKGALLSVCMSQPIIGLVLWLVWKETNREFSKICGIGAIVGVVVGLFSTVIMTVFMIMFGLMAEVEGEVIISVLPSILNLF